MRQDISSEKDERLDLVFKALSDPRRRSILDYLKGKSRTTGEIIKLFPDLSRFGVMKHIDVLRDAGLIIVRAEGKKRFNALNPIPIREMYERWIEPFSEYWSISLLDVRRIAETKNKTP